MTPELKAEWIAALESGKYEKGKHALCEFDKFCCLGVLYEVLDTPFINQGPNRLYDGMRSSINPSTMQTIGLDSEAQERLINLNDHTNTFKPVIEYIKELL